MPRAACARAVVFEFFNCLFDLGVFEDARRPDLQPNCILLVKRFDFARQPQCLAEIAARGDHAVIAHKRAIAVAQRFEHRLGEFLGAVGLVAGASNDWVPRGSDHVMHSRYLHPANRLAQAFVFGSGQMCPPMQRGSLGFRPR
jgi:hypothetical protein